MIIARRRTPRRRYSVPLAGLVNDFNQAYTTPDKFNSDAIAVYFNGQRLTLIDDFTVAESGGPGTGFDTVNFRTTPSAGDRMFSDYSVN